MYILNRNYFTSRLQWVLTLMIGPVTTVVRRTTCLFRRSPDTKVTGNRRRRESSGVSTGGSVGVVTGVRRYYPGTDEGVLGS